jgi:hypothetical protein
VTTAAPVRLGLRENLPQFVLLVGVNALVGGMVGQERTVLPLLAEHEFGLDVIALIGTLRHAQHRSIPEIHAELRRRGVAVCLRSVSNLLDRYANSPTDDKLAIKYEF